MHEGLSQYSPPTLFVVGAQSPSPPPLACQPCANSLTSQVVNEVMPYARKTYGAASDPELVAFGGSSFGGICTLIASMRRPGLFGAALVESPSLWLAEERVLTEDIAQYKGAWPERM